MKLPVGVIDLGSCIVAEHPFDCGCCRVASECLVPLEDRDFVDDDGRGVDKICKADRMQ